MPGVFPARPRGLFSRRLAFLTKGVPMWIFSLLFSLAFADAQAEHLPSESREINLFENLNPGAVQTRETLVHHAGRTYRKVEYKGRSYYLRISQDVTGGNLMELICGDDPEIQKMQSDQNRLIEFRAKMTERTQVFVEALRVECEGDRSKRRLVLSPDVLVGLRFEDDPKNPIKNKKLYWNSSFGGGLGFSGEW